MTKAVNKLFYNWISSAITCTITKIINKPFYNWISNAIMSQSSELDLICSDSISIYCYSHIHKSKTHSFIYASWSWASIIAVQALWYVTLQKQDYLTRWMLFFLLFRWFYQVTFSLFNAILSEKSFYHWNLRNQTFSATNQCLQQCNDLYLLHVQLR